LSCAAFGQSTQTAPAFEVADIHSSARTTNPGMRGGAVRGGRYEVKDASMLDLIAAAYGVQADRIQGGPSWLASDRFDIVAKAPAGTTPKTVNLMLQSLLAERFKLAVHKDTKPMPAYALTVGKSKPKLKEASGSGQSGCQGGNITATAESSDYSCRNLTMQAFAETLRYLEVPGMLQTIPVVDATGLEGTWDFDFKFTSRAQRALSPASAISLLDALDKQLGLKLEVKTTPLEVLAVDSVSQPTANAPDIAAKLPPPPPAEFEVATIRPSVKDEQPRGSFQNGRLDVQALPLKELIKAAWDINSDDLISGTPKFTESAKFDIVAKASNDPAIASQIDDQTVLLMLRALLVDRFKLATHMEERPVPAYVLSAAKPKLQKADPSNRTACKEGPGADGKDIRAGNPMLNRMLTCQNMTMTQFAEQLPNLVPGYVQTQVADETKLDGVFDFTFAFSGVNVLRNALQGKSGDAAAASEPNGALSLSDALNKQLGLKLELQKRNAQILVIDHVEEKPADN
jgi:uncharacterized protein (TIGR03435 family)